MFEFNAAGLAFPVTVPFSGATISKAEPEAEAEFEFDAGPNPQPGQEWMLNQELELAGHHLTLVSIAADSRPGNSFMFKMGPEVYGASVSIPGTTPVGGGGGGSGGLTDGNFNVGISYTELPTGKLHVTVANLTVIGDALTWEGQWSPASPRTDWPPPLRFNQMHVRSRGPPTSWNLPQLTSLPQDWLSPTSRSIPIHGAWFSTTSRTAGDRFWSREAPGECSLPTGG